MKKLLFIIPFLFYFQNITAQWVQFGNPVGRRIDHISFPTPSAGYALSSDNSIAKTTDGGITWSVIYRLGQLTGLEVYLFNGLVFTDANVGYAFGIDFWSADYLILKTTNGGSTWQPFTYEHNSAVGECQNADFPTIQTGFVVGDLGIAFKTTNGGSSWQRVSLNTNVDLLDVDFVNANDGFIVDNSGKLHKTTTGGSAWTTINLPHIFTKIQFLTAQDGFAIHENSVYKTVNGGINWQRTGDTLNDKVQKIHFFDTQNGFLLANSRIWKTQNGGQKWHLQESRATFGANQAAEINDFHFIDPNTAFAGGAFYGDGNITPLILKTVNGGGIGINFNLSQRDLRCPYPSVLTAQSSLMGTIGQVEWRLDSILIGNTIGTQSIPIPNPSTTGYHKVFLKAKNGENQVEMMHDFTIEVPPDFEWANLTVATNPCKGESFRLYTNFRHDTYKAQVVSNGRIVVGPKIISSFNTSDNYFDLPAIAVPTTYKIQILTPCGMKEGKSITVTPFDLPDKSLAMMTTSPQLLCGNNHQADIIVLNSQNQITYSLYQNDQRIGDEQIGNGTPLIFTSETFNNTSNFAISATTANGCSRFLDNKIEINVEHPIADFTTNGLNLLAGSPVSVTFAGQEAATYQWSFGANASISTSILVQPPSILYTNTDSTTISLAIKAPLGCRDTIKRKVGFYQTQNLAKSWGQAADISNQNLIKGQDISVDNVQNIVLTGAGTEGVVLPSKAGIKGVQDFEGSPILKYDPFGVLQWHTTIEAVNGSFHQIVAAEHDKDNNILTALRLRKFGDNGKTVFHGFDRKKKVINNYDGSVLAKYSPEGRLSWLVEFKNCAVLDINDIETDANGNIYVILTSSNIWQCQDQFNIVSANGAIQVVENVHSNCLVKISPNGQFLWSKPLSTSHSDIWIEGLKLRVNTQGQIFVVGGGGNGMVLKLGANGNILWELKPHSTSTANVLTSDIVQDSVGNIYIGGSFQNTLVMEGLPPVTSTAGMLSPYNLFLMKIDATGKPLWLKAGFTEGYSENTALQIYKGSLYVSSFFVNDFKYDTATIRSKILLAAFILKVREQDGRYQAHYLLDSPKPDGTETRYMSAGNTLKISQDGYFHWIGELGYTARFGDDSLKRSNALFIAKFKPFETVTSIKAPQIISFDATLFPNPSQNQTNLHLSLTQPTIADIFIIDVFGRTQILYSKVKLEIGNVDIPISTKSKGVYWVVVQMANREKKVLKWLKME